MLGTHKGKFKPRNPDKYKGDPTNIIYRSSWERECMKWFDERTDVIWWMSEERAVWYTDPFAKKKRRYFPDFIICYNRKDGVQVTEMIEVKPQAQVDGPNPNPKRKTAAWAKSIQTYIINQKKWEAATKICEDRGWNFRLLTEANVPGWSGSASKRSTKPSASKRKRKNTGS